MFKVPQLHKTLRSEYNFVIDDSQHHQAVLKISPFIPIITACINFNLLCFFLPLLRYLHNYLNSKRLVYFFLFPCLVLFITYIFNWITSQAHKINILIFFVHYLLVRSLELTFTLMKCARWCLFHKSKHPALFTRKLHWISDLFQV